MSVMVDKDKKEARITRKKQIGERNERGRRKENKSRAVKQDKAAAGRDFKALALRRATSFFPLSFCGQSLR